MTKHIEICTLSKESRVVPYMTNSVMLVMISILEAMEKRINE